MKSKNRVLTGAATWMKDEIFETTINISRKHMKI